MKIYALITLQRYAIEIQVRLFDSIKQCRKEYDLLIKSFENDKYYKVYKDAKHTSIEYDESPEFVVSNQTYKLNDIIDNQVHCVIKGNQECYYPDKENLYLFNNQTKARKQFFDILIEHEEWECGIENLQVKYNEEYFSFDDDEYEWGHCRTELIKIESEIK
tara:strand:+ start:1380 stop:1865 length:486 start_codon:yes stop_codon:yes gene_type:complete